MIFPSIQLIPHLSCEFDQFKRNKNLVLMCAYPCMQNTEETNAKYAVDANLFRLESTNSKEKYPPKKKI